MKIKRFFATDMRQAIRLVRDEQGPDAVILSSRRVDGGVSFNSFTVTARRIGSSGIMPSRSMPFFLK